MNIANLNIVAHPLINHFLTRLRDQATPPDEFRVLCKRLTLLLAIAASSDLPAKSCPVTSPLEEIEGSILADSLVAVVILRAGLGMLDPIVELFPDVAVGYIGLERDEKTAVANSYYAKLPPEVSGKSVFLLDPMLATGGSAAQACDIIKQHHPLTIKMLSVVSAPEGVEEMNRRHPDVVIYTASLDRGLNHLKYIVPGLGDFGDRLYGT